MVEVADIANPVERVAVVVYGILIIVTIIIIIATSFKNSASENNCPKTMLLADRTARVYTIGYWRDNVGLSVYLSVTLCLVALRVGV